MFARTLAVVVVVISFLAGPSAHASEPSYLETTAWGHGWVNEPGKGTGFDFPGGYPWARLTGAHGVPIVGRRITFGSTIQPVLCAAVTDLEGIATCAADARLGYWASFAGDETYSSSTADGYIVCVTTNDALRRSACAGPYGGFVR